MIGRIMMIAGEASGDLHGSGVIRELRQLRPDIEVFGVGGENMRREGMELIYNASDLSFMGFAEVVRHLSFIRSVEQTLERLLRNRRPGGQIAQIVAGDMNTR